MKILANHLQMRKMSASDVESQISTLTFNVINVIAFYGTLR